MHDHSANNPGSRAVVYCRYCGHTNVKGVLRCSGCERSFKDEHILKPVVSKACLPEKDPTAAHVKQPQTLIAKKTFFRLFVIFIIIDILFFIGMAFYFISLGK